MSRATACFSMYSDMSMRTIALSSSKRNSASAFAVSVLPTPVGPRKRKLPMGRFGSWSPLRARGARRWRPPPPPAAGRSPAARSRSSMWTSFCISPSSSRLTGMCVQLRHHLRRCPRRPPPPSRTGAPSVSSASLACLLGDGLLQLRQRRRSAARRARLKSPRRSASACSLRALSSCSLSPLTSARAAFCASHCALRRVNFSLPSASSLSSCARRSRLMGSVSFFSPSRSISSCTTRRRMSSSSVGMESISMRSLLHASSTRSMALSGRKRSAM